jgi:amidohydrolase
MAASDRFQITITGRGGHGASPHLAVDPILASAQVVTALQSIVARNVNPLKSAVVTATSVTGGEAFNVIPATVSIRGTIRSFEPQVRDLVMDRFHHVVGGVAEAMGCQVQIETWRVTPPVVNDLEVATRVQSVAERLLPDCYLDRAERTMGSEDMAYLMDDIPGCYFFIGSADASRGLNAPHHNPLFDFDEAALPRAAALMAAATMEMLG